MTETPMVAPLDQLGAALAAFQAEAPTVPKSHSATVKSDKGSFSYTYAGLADVSEAALPLLAKHGLSFVTLPGNGGLTGVLLHTSGQSLTATLPIHGTTPQQIGSSLTYMRRYLLGCMTGVVTDDDDDGRLAQTAERRRPASDAAVARAVASFAPLGIDLGAMERHVGTQRGAWTERDMDTLRAWHREVASQAPQSGHPAPPPAGDQTGSGVGTPGDERPAEAAPGGGGAAPTLPPPPVRGPVGGRDGDLPAIPPEHEPVTQARLKLIHASFARLGLGGNALRDQRLDAVSRIVGRTVTTTSALTKQEATRVIDTLGQVEDAEALARLLDERTA